MFFHLKSSAMSGFCQVKKIQKSEKNSEVGGWVKPQLGFAFFFENLYFLCFFSSCFHVFQKKNKKMDKGMGGCGLTNPSFSRIFFNLTKLSQLFPLYLNTYVIGLRSI